MFSAKGSIEQTEGEWLFRGGIKTGPFNAMVREIRPYVYKLPDMSHPVSHQDLSETAP